MAQARYILTEQLHFIADPPDLTDVVVTVQRWARTTGTGGIYVVCFNGVETNRRVCNDRQSMAELIQVMAQTRADHADHLLSEEAADIQVRRRNGPALGWCHREKTCDAPVPYASAVCAYGHPTESVGRVAFASLARKGKVFTLPAGGQNRG